MRMNFKKAWPLILSLWLSACSTLDIILPREERPAAPASKTEQTKPVKSGGYYLDDGPGDNPPADLISIPDAVPKLEPYIARANKPYIALGMTYTPMTTFQPYKKSGIASWYGRRYHGQKTSIGEIYDMYAMTGAHTTLPLPSYVKVTNPDNGKSVIVRINDRGPFHEGRLIDLSYVAAFKLGIAQKGSGVVEVEAIDVKQFLAEKSKPMLADKAIAPETSELPANKQQSNFSAGNYIQLGAFRQSENANQLAQKLREQNILPMELSINNWQNQGLYRVLVGPFDTRSNAEKMAEKIKANLGVNAMIVSF
ncbi:MAG: septal ring lytic transglycosylase RlpA family protein [Methylophilaceae bacterium]|jgi:rare lipoprotein A|nr:septal ring lytic transglycosylase RlpA family protein [Methylophilaceae bacterium]